MRLRGVKITTKPPLALLGAGLLLAAMAGCSTDSPPRHSERLQRAAGLKAFQIDTTKELWEKTSEQFPVDQQDRPIKAKVSALPNGLTRIELSGVGLANYLRELDADAHGGPGTGDTPWARKQEAESIRMYDEISAVLDRTTKRPGPHDPPPRIVVDTAFLRSKPSRTNAG